MLRIVCTVACLLALSVAAADPEGTPKAAAADEAVLDRDIVPISRTEPRWPERALRSGISGSVRVRGTVQPDGSVSEVHVVASHPPGVFDSAVIRAVTQWKFKPRIVDGFAVAREFEQTLTFGFDHSGQLKDSLELFVSDKRDDAAAHYAQLRRFCPDRYVRADDAANVALRRLAPSKNLRDSFFAVEPERQARADAHAIREVEKCVFSSWEQFRDPEAYEQAAWVVGFGYPSKVATESAEALLAVADTLRGGGAAAPIPPQRLLQVRSWLFKRSIPAYYDLINAQAAQLAPAKATGAAAIDALARANEATARRQGKETRSILVKALRDVADPVDRGLLLLALARAETALRDEPAAIIALEEALALEGLPWNVMLTAEMARATLCGRTGDGECFEASRTKLNTELGVTDKFKF